MAAVTATTTEQAITAAISGADSRLWIQNLGPSDCYISRKSGGTAADSIRFYANTTIEIQVGNGRDYMSYDVWIFTGSGTADVRWDTF